MDDRTTWVGTTTGRGAAQRSGPWSAVAVEEPVAPVRGPAARWLAPALIVGAALVGVTTGGLVGAGAADDQGQVDRLTSQVADLRQQVDERDQQVVAADARTGDAESRAEDAESQIAGAVAAAQSEAAAGNASTTVALDAREADIAAREAAVAGRETAVQVLEQQAADQSIPGTGLHFVGTEIAPGTYRATSGEDCYWERLSGTSGSFEDIITNGIGAGDATVTIAASDSAFSSERCGSWQRVG